MAHDGKLCVDDSAKTASGSDLLVDAKGPDCDR